MNKYIKIILALAAITAIVVVVLDYISTQPDKRPANPFEYNIDEFRETDEGLIGYREIRQISLGDVEPRNFAYGNGKIFLITKKLLQIITPTGNEIFRATLDYTPNCITQLNEDNILIGFENFIVKYDTERNELLRTEIKSDKSYFTSIAVSSENIFVADAGEKKVLVYNHKLEKISDFKGESGVSDFHGFILPSAHFHLAVNTEDELWVVNPGMHIIQNYTPTGRLRGYWGKPSFGHDGFSGCCNPSYFAFLSNGDFVTSEKGLVRIKVHRESGEFKALVTSPKVFRNSSKALPIAVDENDIILALDFDEKLIRFFELK